MHNRKDQWSTAALRDYVDRRFEDAARSVDMARAAMEHRLEGMNEFRATISDQSRKMLPRSEADIKFSAIEKRLAEHAKRLDTRGGQFSGVHLSWAILVAAAFLALAIYGAFGGG